MEVDFQITSPEPTPQIEDTVGVAREFLDDITTSISGQAVFDSMGVKPNASYILEGPPGTGKTYAIRALNNTLNKELVELDQSGGLMELLEKLLRENEQKAADLQRTEKEIRQDVNALTDNYTKMYLVEYSIGRHGTAYINRGSRIIQSLFDTASRLATHKPVVVVFDEADALMKSRSSVRTHNEDSKNLQTLMTNLQSAQDTENLFIVLMTNYPRAIDPAMLRAGRIDKRYEFKLPDREERAELFKSSIRQRNEYAGYMVVRGFDCERLAEITEGFSNADIDQVVKEAVRKRAREIARDRTEKVIPAGYVKEARIRNAVQKHRSNFKLKDKTIGFR